MKDKRTGMNIDNDHSRRRFLKLSGYGTLGLMASGLWPGIARLATAQTPDTEFIPDLAAADVKVWQVAGGAAEESSPGSAAEEVKEVEVGKKAGGNKVYPGGLVGVSHLDR